MSFEDFLREKKIDAFAFKKAKVEEYIEWENDFQTMHPESFRMAKLFLINKRRKAFPLTNEKDTQ